MNVRTPFYTLDQDGHYVLILDEHCQLDPIPSVALLFDRACGLLKHGDPSIVQVVHREMMTKLNAPLDDRNLRLARQARDMISQAGIAIEGAVLFTPQSVDRERQKMRENLVIAQGRFDVERLNRLLGSVTTYSEFLEDLEAERLPQEAPGETVGSALRETIRRELGMAMAAHGLATEAAAQPWADHLLKEHGQVVQLLQGCGLDMDRLAQMVAQSASNPDPNNLFAERELEMVDARFGSDLSLSLRTVLIDMHRTFASGLASSDLAADVAQNQSQRQELRAG